MMPSGTEATMAGDGENQRDQQAAPLRGFHVRQARTSHRAAGRK